MTQPTVRPILRKAVWFAMLSVSAVFLAAHLVPVKRDNPPEQGALVAPRQINAILERSCYDCHSNRTRWPWYSRIAPLSWLIAHHVAIGRKEINFSEWGNYYPITRRRKLEWMGRALRTEKMPPWSYRLMHPDSRLNEPDRARLERWIQSALAAKPIDAAGK